LCRKMYAESEEGREEDVFHWRNCAAKYDFGQAWYTERNRKRQINTD
jgi:hypothetical protein